MNNNFIKYRHQIILAALAIPILILIGVFPLTTTTGNLGTNVKWIYGIIILGAIYLYNALYMQPRKPKTQETKQTPQTQSQKSQKIRYPKPEQKAPVPQEFSQTKPIIQQTPVSQSPPPEEEPESVGSKKTRQEEFIEKFENENFNNL